MMRVGTTSSILCAHCHTSIETRDDLVTALRWLVVKPFHASCYARNIRSLRGLFINNYPINGAMFMMLAVFSGLLGLFVFASLARAFLPTLSENPVDLGSLLLMLGVYPGLFCIPAGIRLYSWVRFEKGLPE